MIQLTRFNDNARYMIKRVRLGDGPLDWTIESAIAATSVIEQRPENEIPKVLHDGTYRGKDKYVISIKWSDAYNLANYLRTNEKYNKLERFIGGYKCTPRIEPDANAIAMKALGGKPDVMIMNVHMTIDEEVVKRFAAVYHAVLRMEAMSEKSNELLKLLMEDENKYVQQVNEIFAKNDVRGDMIEKRVRKFFDASYEIKMKELDNDIYALEKNYTALVEDLKKKLEKLNEKKMMKSGLSSIVDESWIDYLKKSKKIELLDMDGSEEDELRIKIDGYLDYFDADIYEAFRKHNDTRFNPALTEESWKALDHLFGENADYKIRTFAIWRVCTSGCPQPCSYVNKYEIDRIANPHLSRFNCMGGYEAEMLKAAADNDMIRMTTLMTSSTRSLNLADSPVWRYFYEQMRKSRQNIIETPDGEIISYGELLERMKAA